MFGPWGLKATLRRQRPGGIGEYPRSIVVSQSRSRWARRPADGRTDLCSSGSVAEQSLCSRPRGHIRLLTGDVRDCGDGARVCKQDKTYLAECFWPDVSESRLADAARRIAAESEAVCLELILVSADEIVLGLFAASTPEAVTDVSRRAGLPVERVIEAVCLRPLNADSSHVAGLVSRDR